VRRTPWAETPRAIPHQPPVAGRFIPIEPPDGGDCHNSPGQQAIKAPTTSPPLIASFALSSSNGLAFNSGLAPARTLVRARRAGEGGVDLCTTCSPPTCSPPARPQMRGRVHPDQHPQAGACISPAAEHSRRTPARLSSRASQAPARGACIRLPPTLQAPSAQPLPSAHRPARHRHVGACTSPAAELQPARAREPARAGQQPPARAACILQPPTVCPSNFWSPVAVTLPASRHAPLNRCNVLRLDLSEREHSTIIAGVRSEAPVDVSRADTSRRAPRAAPPPEPPPRETR
jgi:hypothetical protein